MKGLLVVLLATAVASMELAPLLHVNEPIYGRYIVKLKTGETADKMIATLDNVKVLYKYKTVFNGFAAQLTDRMVKKLRESSAVEYIEEDGVVRASTVASWGLDRVDQLALPLDDVYNPVGDGTGIDVYVIDTGINSVHEDYAGRSGLAYDAIENTVGAGEDCNGHGTHCAGTIAGTLYGVAKAANVYGVRVLNCAGSGSWAQVIGGCEWVADNHDGPSVASMSLGGGASPSVDDAVHYMVNAGITVAVAAGNDDANACNYSPARAELAISVGATDSSDTRAYFSNYGTCVDIFAPGVAITSSWIGGSDATNTISGTSMACPHVAGAAAVLLGIDSTITPAQMKIDLQLKSVPDVVQDPQYGSPNLLLYVGEGSGGGFIPTPPPTTPPPPPPPGCGGYFNSTSGTMTSPNYPNDYDNSMDCSYLVTDESGSGAILLTFDYFDLESSSTCTWDALTIYDGASSSDPELGTFCGTDLPGPFTSTGSSLFMHFETDSSITRSGFSASYVTPETGGCGHTFTSEAGLLTSPNFPSNYGNHEYCLFTIQAMDGQTITLSFLDMDVESHASCGADAVEVFDGTTFDDRIANLCGTTIPADVTSTMSSMTVLFISDESVNAGGFRAMYTVQ